MHTDFLDFIFLFLRRLFLRHKLTEHGPLALAAANRKRKARDGKHSVMSDMVGVVDGATPSRVARALTAVRVWVRERECVGGGGGYMFATLCV